MDGSDAYCIYIVNSKGAPLFHTEIFPVLHHYSFGVPFLSPIVIWLKKKKKQQKYDDTILVKCLETMGHL